MGLYKQPNDWTCGPFALKHALVTIGRLADEQVIASIANPHWWAGTNEVKLARAARHFDCELPMVRRDQVLRVLRNFRFVAETYGLIVPESSARRALLISPCCWRCGQLPTQGWTRCTARTWRTRSGAGPDPRRPGPSSNLASTPLLRRHAPCAQPPPALCSVRAQARSPGGRTEYP